MCSCRLRVIFQSSRDKVKVGDAPTMTHKTGFDIYNLLCRRVLIFWSVSFIICCLSFLI